VQRSTRDWLDAFRDFIADARQASPPSNAALATPAGRAERSILATTFATMVAGIDDFRVAWRCRTGGAGVAIDVPTDPAIVLTTSPVGIAAVQDVLSPGGDLAAIAGDRVIAVTEREYRLWGIRRPDDEYRLHVNLWNWVKTRVPPQRWAEFAPHALADGEAFWLHRAGIAGAGALDRRTCRLWKWNGRHAVLLEAHVPERGVSGLGGDERAD
jgi:hypothetical protein